MLSVDLKGFFFACIFVSFKFISDLFVSVSLSIINFVTREFIVAANINIRVSWDVTPCSFADRYRSFGGTCCLQLQCQDLKSEVR
jgi:hypothetical protein